MSVRDELSLLTPRLRRYARALMQASPAPSDGADELVHATFTRILDCGLSERKSDLIMQVFSLLTQLNRENLQTAAGTAFPIMPQAAICKPRTASRAPAIQECCRKAFARRLPPCASMSARRLLLVGLEGFSYAQAARILHLSRSGLLSRLGRARTRLADALAEAPTQASARRLHLRVVK